MPDPLDLTLEDIHRSQEELVEASHKHFGNYYDWEAEQLEKIQAEREN